MIGNKRWILLRRIKHSYKCFNTTAVVSYIVLTLITFMRSSCWCLGLCLRLYPRSLYENGMGEAHCPGVAEENLSHLVLLLKRLDIADMGQCKFLDRPGNLMKKFGANLAFKYL